MIKTIKKINYAKTAELLMMEFPSDLSYHLQNLIEHFKYEIFVVDQQRGRCYFSEKVITIPVWAFKHGKEYLDWYLSHELAHAYAGPFAKHGPLFMKKLKEICPANAIHLELGYKPRNAAAAGISAPIIIAFDL